MKKILMFHMDLDRARQIRKVCDRIGAEAVEISRSDYCQELGYLAGIIGFEKKKEIYMGPELAGEMLVLSGLDDRAIDAFLAAWKEQGLQPVSLKAVLTPNNIRWTPPALFAELQREHAQMH